MNHLRELLIDAAGPDESRDAAGDLRRGRKALNRRRTRVAAGVSGVGIAAASAWALVPGGGAADRGGNVPVASEPGGPAGGTGGGTSGSTERDKATPAGGGSKAPDGKESTAPTVVDGRLRPDSNFPPTVTCEGSDGVPKPHSSHNFSFYPDAPGGRLPGYDQCDAVIFTADGQEPETLHFAHYFVLLRDDQDQEWDPSFGVQEQVEAHGRTFYVRPDEVTQIRAQVASGDWVTAQYPSSFGLTDEEVIDFLNAVTVRDGAEAGVG